MKKTIVALLSLLFVTTIANAQTAADYADKALDRARKNDFKGALALYDKAIEANPKVSEYHINRVFCLANTGEFEQAMQDAEAIPDMFKDSALVYFKVAGFFSQIHDFERAIEMYDKAETNVPGMGDSLRLELYMLRGGNKHSMNNVAGAMADLQKGAKIDSANVDLMINMAGIYDDMNKPEESVRLLKKVLAKDPQNVSIHNNLGFIYIGMGDYKDALQEFDKSIEINKDKKDMQNQQVLGYTYSNRGHVKYKMGDNKGALKDFERSIELAPSNSYVFKNRALLYIATGKTKEACDDLNHAIVLGFTEMYGDEVDKLIKAYCK